MTKTRVMLVAAFAAALTGGSLSAQTTFGLAPDTSIRVQLQVVPFSMTPGYRPRVSPTWVASESSLSCPMPVDGTNTSADTAMVSRLDVSVPPAPMPGAHSVSICTNPLRRPSGVMIP